MRLVDRVQSWLEPHGTAAQAEEVFRSVWLTAVRSSGSTRHPFHQEVLGSLGRLLDAVIRTSVDQLVEVNEVPVQWGDLQQRHPQVWRRLTPEWMRSFVIAEVARVSKVVDSNDFLTKYVPQSDSGRRHRHELTVQHRRSGLRATFFWQDGNSIGHVFAKSYANRSIDPDRTWDHEGLQAVDQWEGLGITSRLYRHGAALQPDLRWGITNLTEQSAAMRRSLHQVDPWRFAAPDDDELFPEEVCSWCVTYSWADLGRAAFEAHPRPLRA